MSLNATRATLELHDFEVNEEEALREKIPVFGLLKRNADIYAKIIPDCSIETALMAIIQ